jgi:23S rRNA pseudouridine955/2504/2580 synthase
MEEKIIDKKTENQRLDKYLKRYMPNAAMGFLYRMLREKKIKVNKKKADGSYILKENDVINIFFSEDTLNKFKGVSGGEAAAVKNSMLLKDGFDKDVIYEDENVLFYNKPAGMLSQKASEGDISACEYLVDYLTRTGQADDDSLRIFKPSAVNRLDRNTSGLLVCVKTLPAAQKLSEMFRERTLEKHYIALVYGNISEETRVRAYLKKDNAANKVTVSLSPKDGYERIETNYSPVAHIGEATLLDVELITGKTHQIRAHLSAMGHPIAGDVKYGTDRSRALDFPVKRQFLHAHRIIFPKCGGVLEKLSGKCFSAKLPEDLLKALGGKADITELLRQGI